MKRIRDLLRCPRLTLTPFAVIRGEEVQCEYTLTQTADLVTLQYTCPDFEDVLKLEFVPQGVVCRRVFTNTSAQKTDLTELGVRLCGMHLGSDASEDYFYHNENARIYECMTFPIDLDRTLIGIEDSGYDVMAGNRWADPGVISERIGQSPYMPFPAILLSNYKAPWGIVHGTLNQDVFYHNYRLFHRDADVCAEIFSSFRNCGARRVEAGESLCDEWYLGITDNADDIEKIFVGYTAELRRRIAPHPSLANRRELVWGSWNDGVFRNVSEEIMLREAEFIRENFPTVKWIQLDDGYSAVSTAYEKNDGIAMPYEQDGGLEKSKFPNGLAHMTAQIRKLGLRPALWVGLFCCRETRLFREHPERFLDYSYRTSGTFVPDVSQSEMRRYMEDAIHTLVTENGFDGVKMDFWSYAFEDKHPLYADNAKSGGEWREWWLSTVRKCLSPDGYLEVACDLAQGNPFLGKYISNHRYGIDIASGKWDLIKTCFLWGTANFACHTGDIIAPNSDSVGIFPDLSDDEMLFWVNYCLATRSLVEISGLLSQCRDTKRLNILKKSACCPDNGRDVHFVGYDYRSKKYSVPEIIYFTSPHFSTLENNAVLPLRTVGIFNVYEQPKTYTFATTDIGLEGGGYLVSNVWTGESSELEGFSITLAPHSSALLSVCRKDTALVYDADIRIVSAQPTPNGVILETDYAVKNAEITLSRKACSVTLNGKPIPFTADKNRISMALCDFGKLEITFETRIRGFEKATSSQVMSQSCGCSL